MASDNSKSGRKLLPGRVGDAVVMLAMALVTLALCVGLIAQSGLGVWLSATVSVSFYIGLLTLHTIVRRTGQIDALSAEVERLRGGMARIGNPQAASAEVRAAAAAVEKQDSASVKSDRGATAAKPAAVPPAMPALDAGQRHGAAEMQRAAAAATVIGSAKALNAVAPTAPANSTARQPVPAGPSVEPPSATASPEFAARMQRAMRTPTNTPPPPPAKQQRNMPNSYSAIPASPPVRTPTPIQPHYTLDDQASALPPLVAEPAYAGVEPLRESIASSPREADVEMIEGLIKKLAAEVDAAEIGKLEPTVAAVDKVRAIEESVGALKRTADTMRAPTAAVGPAASGTVGGADADEVDTQPIGFRRSRDRAAPMTPQQHTHETARAATAPPPAVEPEFDVETLMRRAHSIAAPAAAASPASAPASANEPEFDLDKLMQRAQPIAAMTGAAPPLSAKTAAALEASLDRAAFEADTRDERAEIIDSEADLDTDADSQPADEPQAVIDPRLARVAAAIDAGRVEVYLEPILDIARQQPSHYEVTVCLRDADGAEIGGGDDAVERNASAVLPLLDSVRLSRTAQVARLLEERRRPGSVFSTFSGAALSSDEFLGTFADTFEANETLAHQLVLTFAQADVRGFCDPQWAMLQEMRELGFRFALRAVTDLDMDFEPLAHAGFAFAKLDADVFLDGLTAPGAIIPAADICHYLADQGLAVVAEHIDDEAKRARLSASGVQLGQGQLFGGPRLMKASALAAPRPVAA